MPIPVQFAHRFIYHFSHIDNLPGLLQNGFLATNHTAFPRRHRSIASAGIQERLEVAYMTTCRSILVL
jgi:hypothetical protein